MSKEVFFIHIIAKMSDMYSASKTQEHNTNNSILISVLNFIIKSHAR